MLRLILGLPIAAIVTAALFFLMGDLVKPGEFTPGIKKDPPVLPTMRDEPDPKPVEPPSRRLELDPPPPITRTTSEPGNPGPIVGPKPPAPTGPGSEMTFTGPTGAVPIATIPPTYPPSCQSRATEGYAVVRYDVTFQGQVVNAEVTDRSHRCFEQAALSAIRSWRYQPAATKEEGYIARGLTKRFTFTLN